MTRKIAIFAHWMLTAVAAGGCVAIWAHNIGLGVMCSVIVVAATFYLCWATYNRCIKFRG